MVKLFYNYMPCNSQDVVVWLPLQGRLCYSNGVKDRPETGHRSPSEDLIVGRLTVKHCSVGDFVNCSVLSGRVGQGCPCSSLDSLLLVRWHAGWLSCNGLMDCLDV